MPPSFYHLPNVLSRNYMLPVQQLTYRSSSAQAPLCSLPTLRLRHMYYALLLLLSQTLVPGRLTDTRFGKLVPWRSPLY